MAAETVKTKNSARTMRAEISTQAPDDSTGPLYLDLPLPGERVQIPDQTSTDYRAVSQKAVYYPETRNFNSQPQQQLRKVTVSGMRLIWDAADALLGGLSEQLDLEHVLIVADSVVINMPVKLPQTRVEIYARELIFGANGSIDVSPVGFREGERPEPGFETDGNGKYTGKSGRSGMDAQSIELNVKTLRIPESDKRLPVKRLIARGSRGQDGGEGGFLDLEGKPLSNEQLGKYYEDNKATVAPPAIVWESVRETIKNKWLVTFPVPIPTPFRKFKPVGGRFHFDGPRSNGFPDTPNEVSGKHVIHYHVLVHLPFGMFYVLRFGFQLPPVPVAEAPIPRNGLDAYPYGRPGAGGKGGRIRCPGQLAFAGETDGSGSFDVNAPGKSCNLTVEDLADVAAGEKGVSFLMKGALPALTRPAVKIALTVSFRKQSYRTGRKPGYATRLIPVRKIEQTEVDLTSGVDAAAPEARDGDPGAVEHVEQPVTSWVHEFNSEAAFNYARHACILYNRELSRQVARTYLDDIWQAQAPLPPMLAALELEFDTLLSRLDSDLDIYGNRFGWVPHLSVVGTFEHLRTAGLQAIRNIYLCRRLKRKWDQEESKLEYLTASREATSLRLDRARKTLVSNHKEFSRVQKKLRDTFLQRTSLQGEIASLEEKIKTEAEIDEKNRAYYIGQVKLSFGAAKLILGGLGILTEVIPVGQPFLGMVGRTGTNALGGVYDVVEKAATAAIEGDAMTTYDVGSLISEKAGAYLKEKQTDLTKIASKPLTEGLDRDLKSTRKDLAALGQKTRALAGKKENLQKLLALPGGQIPVELERLFRVEQTRDSATFKILAPAEQKELAELLRRRINARISTLESAKEDSGKLIEDLRDTGKKADVLAGEAAKLSKNKQKIENNVGTALKGMAQMSGDMQGVFDGIRSLCLSREDLEPKIAAQIEKLKSTVYAGALSDLYARVVIAGRLKEELFRRLERCQMNIREANTAIRSAITEINMIDRQALGLTYALDHSVYSSLSSIEHQARSILIKQLYYFGKAYQYRFLQRVESLIPDYYKLDIVLDKLERFLSVDKSDIDDEIDEIYSLLFAKFQVLSSSLIDDVQHYRLAQDKPQTLHALQLMDAAMLQNLNTPLPGQKGKMVRYEPAFFNFVDAGYANTDAIKFRIADINLVSVKLKDLEQFSQGLSFDLNFVHSGRSLLYDGDRYYLFQAQSPAERISWEFTVSIDSNGQPKVSRVKDSTVSTQLLQKLCGARSSKEDAADLLNAYMPGGSSDITIYRTGTGKIAGGEITDFVVEVTLEEMIEEE